MCCVAGYCLNVHCLVQIIVSLIWLCDYFFCVIILYKYIWLSYCFILDVLPHTYTAIDRYTIFENHKADREKKDSFTPIAYNIFGRFCWFFLCFFFYLLQPQSTKHYVQGNDSNNHNNNKITSSTNKNRRYKQN